VVEVADWLARVALERSMSEFGRQLDSLDAPEALHRLALADGRMQLFTEALSDLPEGQHVDCYTTWLQWSRRQARRLMDRLSEAEQAALLKQIDGCSHGTLFRSPNAPWCWQCGEESWEEIKADPHTESWWGIDSVG